MKVHVLFFGATADAAGERETTFMMEDDSKVGQTVSAIAAKYPKLIQHKLLFSINQEYARGNEILRDGDELAIFTAVSGG